MEIFCGKCQKRVGQVADEKIPVGQKASVTCPTCGEKIILSRPAPITPESDFSPPPPPPESGTLAWPKAAEPQPAGASPDYDFRIGAVLSEAWQKTSGVKGPLWGAGFVVFLAMMVVIMVMAILSRALGLETGGIALGAALQLTFTVALYPFMAGLLMIGIRRSVGLPVNWRMAFGYFSYLLPVVGAALLMMIMNCLGFALLILPGIYLSLAYTLTIPLVVDKGMGPWQAMEASRRAIHRHWFKVFGLYLAMGLICFLSMIPLGLGLIWTIPMFIMVGGILYREIFGVSEQA